MTSRLEAFGVGGVGEVRPGDDVAALLVGALIGAGIPLLAGDIVVISSKIVSKAENRSRPGTTREAAVAGQTLRIVAERVTPRGTTRIVHSHSGPVLAAAGVDASNVAPGTVLLLPADPDSSARALRARLRELTGLQVGVVITDTLGRPWRDGQVDAALGAAGVRVLDDLRGGIDPYGNALEVTSRALADELAALADLVKGKVDGVPAAVVRGLSTLVTDDDGPGAAAMLRPDAGDWFRYGHVEAVRASLGVPPGTRRVAPQPMPPGGPAARLARAVAVALAAPRWLSTAQAGPSRPLGAGASGGLVTASVSAGAVRLAVAPDSAAEDHDAALVGLGVLAQRILAAAWSEGLSATAELDGREPPAVVIRAGLAEHEPGLGE